MNQVKIILDKLSHLDLSKYPVIEIRDLIKQLGIFGQMIVNVPVGTHILRGRMNKGDESFENKSQLTYKSMEINKTYARASTPNQTMFYGTIIPDSSETEEDNLLIITLLSEICDLIKNNNIKEGEAIITLGSWSVINKIPVISTVYNFDTLIRSNFIHTLKKEFEIKLSKMNQIFQARTKLICDFFDKEFSKKETPNDYDYLISAIYSEILTHYNAAPIAGVFYPSVRTDKYKGIGLNIAITTGYADNYIKLEKVTECKICKKNGMVSCKEIGNAILKNEQENFILKKSE